MKPEKITKSYFFDKLSKKQYKKWESIMQIVLNNYNEHIRGYLEIKKSFFCSLADIINIITPEESLMCNNKLRKADIKKWLVALNYEKTPNKASLKELTDIYNYRIEELELYKKC